VSVLIHPSPAARLSAAWCLRSIAIALPSQMTIFIERCVTRMQRLKSSTEAISGYSFALAALLGGVRETTLGIPHAKGKVSFLAVILNAIHVHGESIKGDTILLYISLPSMDGFYKFFCWHNLGNLQESILCCCSSLFMPFELL